MNPPEKKPRTPCISCSPGCLKHEIRDGFGSRHPLFVQSLGLCSAIALTGYVQTTLVIGLIILVTATLSAFLLSLLRRLILSSFRMIVEVALITTLVTLIHLLLRLYWPDMRAALGPYLGLVITNCLIMDACEQTALHHPPLPTLRRAFGNTLGYVALLLIVSLVREPLGHGSLAGIRLFHGESRPLELMSSGAGAFFVLGLLWWIMKAFFMRPKTPEHA